MLWVETSQGQHILWFVIYCFDFGILYIRFIILVPPTQYSKCGSCKKKKQEIHKACVRQSARGRRARAPGAVRARGGGGAGDGGAARRAAGAARGAGRAARRAARHARPAGLVAATAHQVGAAHVAYVWSVLPRFLSLNYATFLVILYIGSFICTVLWLRAIYLSEWSTTGQISHSKL